MHKSVTYLVTFIVIVALSASVYSHCQVPCGIYGDQTRVTLLREHITTIEKSMKQIIELSTNPSKNMNQLLRWVNNKDQHADEFTNIITYYFLAQRIKIKDKTNAAEYADYQSKVTTLHQMMVFAMKSKQTTDLENVKKLNELLDQFEAMYFSAADKVHLKEHQK
jgi:nickel superoxide dismutase